MASSSGTSPLKGRWTIWIIALVFSLLAGFGVLTIIGSAAEQQTYYTVSQDIPARTPITVDIAVPITTSAEGYPSTALTLAEIESGLRYSLVALKSNEILTISNTGPLAPITSTVPEDFVAVSIAVAPENAVGGRVKPGDIVDIAAVAETTGSPFAKVVLSGLLVLDVSVAPSSIAGAATANEIGAGLGGDTGAPGPDSLQARSGIPQLYTFAVSLEDFAKLALLRDKNLYIALARPEYADIDRTAEAYEAEIFGTGPTTPGTEEDFVFEEEVIVEE